MCRLKPTIQTAGTRHKDDQATESASPVIFMVGASVRSLACLTSGLFKTRSENWSPEAPAAFKEPKSAIGVLTQGILMLGGSAYDCFSAIGAIFCSFAAQNEGPECEDAWETHFVPPAPTLCYDIPTVGAEAPPPIPNYDYRLCGHAVLQGSENVSQSGKRISVDAGVDGEGNAVMGGPVDGRNQSWKEADVYEPVPAVVKYMIPVDAWVYMDNQRTTELVASPNYLFSFSSIAGSTFAPRRAACSASARAFLLSPRA